MKKTVYLLIGLLFSIILTYAMTEEDKAEIRAIVDETYKYYYSNPAPHARSRAQDVVSNRYLHYYIKCKNNCEAECQSIRSQRNSASVLRILQDPDEFDQKGYQYFHSCMEQNCNSIRDIEMQECNKYIDEYIEYKNKIHRK